MEENYSWVISPTQGSSSLFFKQDRNKILGSLLTIVCSISSDYTISQCILDTRMSMYAHKICLAY